MFFRPRFNTKKYARRGFRLRGNTLVLLFVFFLIGLFLHYGGKTKPVVAFWNDVREIIGLRRSHAEKEESNPYRAPEPDSDVATDERPEPSASESEASDKRGRRSSKTKTNRESKIVRFEFEKQVDFILPVSRSGGELIRHEGYTLSYRDEYKDAEWVAYPLLDYETTGDADRKNEQFQPDRAAANGTALPSDYTRSGYDRGHLAPAGDFKYSQRMMRETFLMSNITPQVPDFNRGIWKELEDLVRTWAVRDNGLYIITGPVLKAGLPTIGKANEVSVPQKFYKVILYCNKPDIRMIGFLLDNEASESSLKQFVVPVDQIEQLTGIDFFPKLPDDLERKLESKGRGEMVDEWFSN
ncbi:MULTISPECIES: DNA/RNA non-specific endonuclease [Spirosoma]|uniref:Endonuclease n=1 Tax=Spirosoma liriopis TaxID=2937440 RepID=A0ABT0HDJ1_9BACT|nr:MULTISPECIES: DNA/RNA non-specific endonuclease [Spirosoma]MCK8490227.1 DNA/RNA non-specific endonuclease [Spirosoma liriopis]UHG89602.1 DNA/RNA non-specific endonuclease [Spirosoma oryzicola]